MRKWLLGLLAVGLLLAARLWWGSESRVVGLTDQQASQALLDGSGARGLVIERPEPGVPASLAEARALLDPNQLQAASEALRDRLQRNPDDGAAHVFLSEILRRTRASSAACEHGLKGAELLPTSSEAHWVYARALLADAAQLGRAGGLARLAAAKRVGPFKAEIRTAIELNPNLIEARKEEALFLIFAPLVGDLERGTELAHALEEIDPLEGGLCVARALSAADDGVEAALAKAQEVHASYPSSQEPPWVLANLYFQAERWEEALAALAGVLEGPKQETYYQALHLRARICNDRSVGFEQALADLDELRRADPRWEWAPQEAQVECERGYALLGLGRREQARLALERSLELDPHSKRSQAGLEDLKVGH